MFNDVLTPGGALIFPKLKNFNGYYMAGRTAAALKIFSSNLFLKNRKIEFTPQTQWAALSAAHEKVSKLDLKHLLVGVARIERATLCLKGRCSTTELHTLVLFININQQPIYYTDFG